MKTPGRLSVHYPPIPAMAAIDPLRTHSQSQFKRYALSFHLPASPFDRLGPEKAGCTEGGPSSYSGLIEVSVATASPNNCDFRDRYRGRFLAELQRAHAALLQSMSELDELTRGPVPPTARIIEARWNISRASLTRRMLWGKIHTQLLDRVSPENAAVLLGLRKSDMALLRLSSEHVSKWTIETVVAHWSTYCEASRAIRLKMKHAIDAEVRLLYPLLETEGSAAPRATSPLCERAPPAHDLPSS